MSFYQLARTVAYALSSALSATLLVVSVPRGHAFPADEGYTSAALASTAILGAALVVSLLFPRSAANPHPLDMTREADKRPHRPSPIASRSTRWRGYSPTR
jgi:hypothetical protein